MAQRNEQIYPKWLLDAAGAPRKGRVLDEPEPDEEDNVALPGGNIPDLGPPLRVPPRAAPGGPPPPGGLAAMAGAMGGGGAGPTPPPGAPPMAPAPPMPGGMSPPVPGAGAPTGLPPLPGGAPPPLPPPSLGPPPIPAGLPPTPPSGPAPLLPRPPLGPAPLAPSQPSAPVIGVGGSQAPGSAAPTLTIHNSVVNVGQQDVQSQGGPLGSSGTESPGAGRFDTNLSGPITANGLPPMDSAIPDLGPPPTRLPAPDVIPTAPVTPPANPTPNPIGPRYNAATGRYA